jgi:indole-3-glycerol phosphate synthase
MKTPPAILGKIASRTVLRIAKVKETVSMKQVMEPALALAEAERAAGKGEMPLLFERAVAAPGLSFICEVKKASPSKGVIAEDFPYLQIAKEYEEAGASAISVLTEPDFFLGNDQHLKEISCTVQIPTLRKDFIIDPYQLYEAKLLGAKAVLLICALLDPETLSLFISIAGELALDCLVEIHSDGEVLEALQAGAGIIGINNRDLTTFEVDTDLTPRLRKLIPSRILTVAESGVKSPDDIRALKDSGVDAVLIGESLMRSTDRKQFLRELMTAAN